MMKDVKYCESSTSMLISFKFIIETLLLVLFYTTIISFIW